MRTVIAAAVLLTTGCAPSLLKLPAGPGAPASDIREALTEAISGCRAIDTMTAEIGVAGSVGGRRLRARLLTGLASPASARIEAFAFGQQIFFFVARGDDGTLLLTRERRVLEHGRPAAMLEAVAVITEVVAPSALAANSNETRVRVLAS